MIWCISKWKPSPRPTKTPMKLRIQTGLHFFLRSLSVHFIYRNRERGGGGKKGSHALVYHFFKSISNWRGSLNAFRANRSIQSSHTSVIDSRGIDGDVKVYTIFTFCSFQKISACYRYYDGFSSSLSSLSLS